MSFWGAVSAESPSLAGSAQRVHRWRSLWLGSLHPSLLSGGLPPSLLSRRLPAFTAPESLPPHPGRPGLAFPFQPLPPSLVSVDWNPACLQGRRLSEAFWVCPGPQWSCLWSPETCPLNTQGFSTHHPPQPRPTVGFWKERQALANNPEEKSVQINLMSPFPPLLPQEHRMG